MRIAIAQLDPVVGAFEANVKKLKEAFDQACRQDARILITPELGICGYPPHDLIERPEIFERNEKALKDLCSATVGKSCALVAGHVTFNSREGRPAQNTVSVLEKGIQVFHQSKTLLPTYDVFDEARYFEPAKAVNLWNCDGLQIALAICEDLWGSDPSFGRKLYGQDPVESYCKLQPDLLFSLSASPYEWGKRKRREELHHQISRKLNVPLVYVNQVGATDEVLFDGGSFAVDPENFEGRLPFFKTSFGIVETEAAAARVKFKHPTVSEREDTAPEEIDLLSRALVTGIREYFQRTGFKKAIIGLSGGIDSALVAVLVQQALGAKNVLGVAMPSQFSSGHSLEDAELLATQLGIGFEVRPIKFMYSVMSKEISNLSSTAQIEPLALENLQARLRGIILMTLANHHQALVVTTGNKSELAMGYCTQYGDMVGAIAPIGDVYKTRVYELARYLNVRWNGIIPERSITKAPSAELRPNQTDQDTLPPYEVLDPLLEDYLEKKLPVEKLLEKHSVPSQPASWVKETLRRIELNEHKRRQAAPVLKISPKAFGIGRRIPISKHWDQ